MYFTTIKYPYTDWIALPYIVVASLLIRRILAAATRPADDVRPVAAALRDPASAERTWFLLGLCAAAGFMTKPYYVVPSAVAGLVFVIAALQHRTSYGAALRRILVCGIGFAAGTTPSCRCHRMRGSCSAVLSGMPSGLIAVTRQTGRPRGCVTR